LFGRHCSIAVLPLGDQSQIIGSRWTIGSKRPLFRLLVKKYSLFYFHLLHNDIMVT